MPLRVIGLTRREVGVSAPNPGDFLAEQIQLFPKVIPLLAALVCLCPNEERRVKLIRCALRGHFIERLDKNSVIRCWKARFADYQLALLPEENGNRKQDSEIVRTPNDPK
jgi:hypothetical protein